MSAKTPVGKTGPEPRESEKAASALRDLKGIFGKPARCVSIAEMNCTAAKQAARAGRITKR